MVIFSNSPAFFSLSVLRYASAATRTRVLFTPLGHVCASCSTSCCVRGNFVFRTVFARGTVGINIDNNVVKGNSTRFSGRLHN